MAGEHQGVLLLVGVQAVRVPVGQGRAVAHQFVGPVAAHAAEGRVHVGDATVHVPGPHADDHGVLHGLAEGMLVAQGLFRRQALLDQAADGKEAPEDADGQDHDGAGQDQLGRVAGIAVGDALQHEAVARRVKGQFVGQPGLALDVGLAGQHRTAVVQDAQLVFLGKPPGHQVVEHGLEGIGHHQHAGEIALAVDGHEQVDLAVAAGGPVGVGVGGLAQLAGEVEGVPGDGAAEDVQLLPVGDAVGVGLDQVAAGVEPDHLFHFRVVLDDVLGLHLEHRRRRAALGGAAHVEAGAVELVFVARHVEAEILFQPEDVGDEGGPLLLHLVAMQEPQQADQGNDQQPHRQLGHQQGPAGPLQDAARGRNGKSFHKAQ